MTRTKLIALVLLATAGTAFADERAVVGAGGPPSQNRGPNETPGRDFVRLGPAASIEDEAGAALTLDDVQVGTELRVVRHAFREGFFEAQRVVVLR